MKNIEYKSYATGFKKEYSKYAKNTKTIYFSYHGKKMNSEQTSIAVDDVSGRSICPHVQVDNRPKFKLRRSISWTDSDAGPRLSF